MARFKTHLIVWISAVGLVFLAISGITYRRVSDISDPFPEEATPLAEGKTGRTQKVYYIGVISRYPPTLIYQGYQPIIDYLNAHTPYRFALKLNRTYRQAGQQLVNGKVVAAFFGSYLFAREREKYHLHCVLKPLNEQFRPVLHAVLVVPLHSSIRSLKDLRGKKLALPSPYSYSANWLRLGALQKNGLRFSDLDSVHYFAHHHTVVYEVLKGHFDAGVVKDRVAKEFLQRGMRVVAQSPPIPSSPVVMAPGAPPGVIEALKTALLAIDVHDPQMRDMLSHWDREFAYGFVVAHDADYDSLEQVIREKEKNEWPR